jgi:type I restriction enzyme M protein
MSYGECVEQLTYLLFLKMADERSAPPHLPAPLRNSSKPSPRM